MNRPQRTGRRSVVTRNRESIKMPRKKKSKTGRGPGRPKAAVDARRLATEMKDYHRALLGQRGEIDQKISAVGQAIAALGGPAPAAVSAVSAASAASAGGSVKRGPGRPKGSTSRKLRPGSLKDHIHKVLVASSTPVSLRDLTKRVIKSGYKTNSKTLGNQVSAAVASMRAKKAGRGLYTA